MNGEQEGGGKLSRTTLVNYSAFRFADILVMQTVGSFLRLFYVTTYAIDPLWIAFVHPLLKGFDVVTDPILGQLSDNTKSKMGRRRPWVLYGGIALGISFALFCLRKVLKSFIGSSTTVCHRSNAIPLIVSLRYPAVSLRSPRPR